MFGRNAEVEAKVEDVDRRLSTLADRQKIDRELHEVLRAQDRREYTEYTAEVVADPQEAHQTAILADFQTAVRVNDDAARCLRHAEAVAAQAALALVESRKQMRRVSEGTI